ncbi:hypothetical protein CMUS01_13510 [Colletotrichum musicola]|uniref:Uncharacterized protein n=1 Tax=Colletotrichum musicola TaxID=2175873 RepID=A0A8H6JBW6_9PEZI|nr:hypothetical protein CMUS01_13510 [Colletotrichum musicola]
MEIWAFANIHTVAPTAGPVQSSLSTVTELPRMRTWAQREDLPTTTTAHTTLLLNTPTSTHRFWNATFAQNTPNISTVISVTTTTPSSNLEPSWTYHKPTMDISTVVPVSATVLHRARCDCLAALFIFFVVVSFWENLG